MKDQDLIQALRCCTNSPKIDKCKAECAFFCGGDMGHCIPRMGKAVADRMEALLAERAQTVENAERCVFCGAIIPEGRQVCFNCEKKLFHPEERKSYEMNAYKWLANQLEKANVNKIKVMLDPGAKMPTRAHDTDAGLDLYSPVDAVIYHSDSVKIDTGVHVAIPAGYVGMVKSKSGLNVRYNITSEGVIDCGYTGSIVVKLYNHGNCSVRIEKGQKISQLVLLPIITPELELVDNLESTDRGNGGFGSTGKF